MNSQIQQNANKYQKAMYVFELANGYRGSTTMVIGVGDSFMFSIVTKIISIVYPQ